LTGSTFDGKVAVVTGAASGIGRALACALAAEGAEIAISDIDAAGLAASAQEAKALGAKVSDAVVDVANRAAVDAWATAVVADHGRVNLVFNNAGVALDATIEQMSDDDLAWLLNINFWGVVHGTKAFLPHLIASGDGHVVNISSVFGIIAVPGNGAYNAAKFAVRGYTECLRQELAIEGHPVTATCVHPGGIKTNIARNARRTPGGIGGEAIDEFDRFARTTAAAAAATILAGVRRNRRRVLVGTDARVIDFVQRLFPTGYQRVIEAATRRRRS
jgi:NAD(P)-dependent dehydrogenase (short-subunit alcohol dehydrogenase family)